MDDIDDLVGTLTAPLKADKGRDFGDPEVAALALPALATYDPQGAVKAGLKHRLPFEALGVDNDELGQSYGRELRLERERDRFKGAQESVYGAVARRMLPGGSAVFNLNEEQDYADAQKRFAAGTPEEGDYAKIAGHERLQQIDKERTTGESVLAAVAHVPAILGEGAFAGKIVSGGAKALAGAARAAPVAGEAASAATQASRLARVGQFGARVAATTPLMPSMYLAEAGKRAAQNGGRWDDKQNIVPAYAMGMATVAVLGSLQKFVTTGTFAQKVVGKTAVGMAEQQAVDASAQAFSDAVLNKAWKVETGYGLAGDVFRAARGKENNALKHALSQAAVFGIFSAMHAGGKRDAAVDKGAKLTSDLTKLIGDKGLEGFPPEVQAEYLREFAEATAEIQAGPMTKEAARAVAEKTSPEFRPAVDKIAENLPTAAEAAKLLEGMVDRSELSDAITRTEARPRADADRLALDRAVELTDNRKRGRLRMRPGEIEGERLFKDVEPTPDPRGVEPVPDAPVPPDPIRVIGEANVRLTAKRLGISAAGDVQAVFDRMMKQPKGKNALDILYRSKLPESTRPAAPEVDVTTRTPETAPEGPTGDVAPKPVDSPAGGADRPQADTTARKRTGLRLRPGEIESEADAARMRERNRRLWEGVRPEDKGLMAALDAEANSAPNKINEAVWAIRDEVRGRLKTGDPLTPAEWRGVAAKLRELGIRDSFTVAKGEKPVLQLIDELPADRPAAPQELPEGAKSSSAIRREARRARMADMAKPPEADPRERVLADLIRDAGLDGRVGDVLPGNTTRRTVAVGDQDVRVEYDPEFGALKLDFTGDLVNQDIIGVKKVGPEGITKDAVAVFRTLNAIAKAARKANLRVVYEAEPVRHSLYARGLEKAGYEVESATPQGGLPFTAYVWTPAGLGGKSAPRIWKAGRKPEAAPDVVKEMSAPPAPAPAKAGVEAALAEHARAPEGSVARRALDAALGNLDALPGEGKARTGHDPKEVARRLVSARLEADALKGTPEDVAALDRVLAAAGVRQTAKAGEVVPFDGLRHKSEQGLSTGQAVRVTRPGWELPTDGGVYPVEKAVVRASAAAPTLTAPDPARRAMVAQMGKLGKARKAAVQPTAADKAATELAERLAGGKGTAAVPDAAPPTLREALQTEAAKKLDKKELYVATRRAEDPQPSFEQIAKDGKASGDLVKAGAKPGKGNGYTAARVKQFEQAAFKKLGLETSAAKEVEAEAGERQALRREAGGRAERAGKEGEDPGLSAVRETPAEAAERKYTGLLEKYGGRAAEPEVAAVLEEVQARIAAGTGIRPTEWKAWTGRLAKAKPPKAGKKPSAPKSPEDSLRKWVASEGGIHARDLEALLGKQWQTNEGWAVHLSNTTTKGGLDNLAEAAHERQFIPEPTADALLKALKADKLIGEAAHKKAERDLEDYYRKKQEQEPTEPYTPSAEDIPWSPGSAAPPRGRHLFNDVEAVTPAVMNAEVNAAFGRVTGAKDYRGESSLPGGAEAYADLSRRNTATSKKADQDPFTTLEEAAHHLSYDRDPAKRMPTKGLPADVVSGFDALNRVFRPDNTYKGPQVVVEGYASWVKLHAAGQAKALTGDAKAAAEWAEAWTKSVGKMGPIDKVTPLFRNFMEQSPTQRAQGLGSSTGKPVVADRTPGEVARSVVNEFKDAIDNDLYPAMRLEEAIRKAGGKVDAEKALSLAMEASARAGDAAGKAGRWAEQGVPVMTPDGHLQKHGPSVGEIEAGAKPEWLAPGPNGAASKAGAYHTAWHVVSERQVGLARRAAAITAIQQTRAARNAARKGTPLREAMNKDLARLLRVSKQEFKESQAQIDLVPEESYKTYEAALKAWDAEPEFGGWAKEYAKKQTAGFEAIVDLFVSVGRMSPEQAAAWRKNHPQFSPTERVQAGEAGWNLKTSPRKGEKGGNVSKERSGSGEAIVDPRLVYQRRLLWAAEQFNRQRTFLAAYELAQQPGAGPFLARPVLGERTLTKRGVEKSAELKRAGLTPDKIPDALKDMGVRDGEIYFSHEAWPEDGSKPTYEGFVEGRPASVRVGDRSLYDLLTNQQVDAHQTARLIRGLAQMEIFGVKPVQVQAQVVRTGATALSAAFQFKNLPRDMLTYWRNTIDRFSTKELLPEYWKTYGRMARVFADNFGAAIKDTKAGRLLGVRGERGRAEREDPLWRAFRDARGDQLKQFAFERDNPEASYNGIKSTPTVRHLLKDVLNVMGAGELAPRFLEYKNKAKAITGKSLDALRAEYAAYYKALDGGGKPKAPLTPGQEALMLNAAWEVTAPFPRQGVVTRQFNQITPFFGPAVAGVSKAIRNWKSNPSGALYALGLVGALRAVHWLLVKDEKWYDELSPNDKFNNFVVPTPIGPRRLPGPRDLDIAVGGLQVMMMDAAYGKDPKFRGYLEQSLEGVLPPGVGPAAGELVKGDVGMAGARTLALPGGPVGQVGVELMMNKDWTGKPIVPRRDQGKTSDWDQFAGHIAPYAAKQLTGGRAELSVGGLGLNPVPRVKSFRESVNDLYDRLHELDIEKEKAKRAGSRFKEEAEYKKLSAAREEVEKLSAQGRGERKVGTKVVKGERPDADSREAIQLRQAEVARRALGR